MVPVPNEARKVLTDYECLGLSSAKKEEGGKQEKGPLTGKYKDEKETEYYIKQSLSFPADNIAEVATGRLLRLVIGEQAVQYEAVRDEDSQQVYIACERSLKPLKDQIALPLPVIGADPFWGKNKEAIDEILDTPAKRKGMARVLAGCLWVNDTDCQTGNILLGKKDGKDVVKKFDHGWGLVDICKPEHAQVRLFEGISPDSKEGKGTHPPSGMFSDKFPTNHFNDYPNITRSEDFAEALREILRNTTETQIKNTVEDIVGEIKTDYEGSSLNAEDTEEALKLFAKHIGLDISKQPADKTIDDFIKENLTQRMKERAASMALLKCMLEIDLELAKESPDSKKIVVLAIILQQTILEKFKEKGGYAIDKILPPYDPSFSKLMKKSIKLMNKDPFPNPAEQEASISFCTALSEKSNREPLNTLFPAGWDKDPPDPALMGRLLRFEADADEIHGERGRNPEPNVAPIVAKNLHKTNTTTNEAQTYKTFSTYCERLIEELQSASPALSESQKSLGQKSLEIDSLGQKITVTHLPNNAINTSLPDNLADLKKVFPQVLAANIKAGLTQLSPSGSLETIKYMTKEILEKGLEPVITKETKKFLETHGLDEARFFTEIKKEIAAEKAPAHLKRNGR